MPSMGQGDHGGWGHGVLGLLTVTMGSVLAVTWPSAAQSPVTVQPSMVMDSRSSSPTLKETIVPDGQQDYVTRIHRDAQGYLRWYHTPVRVMIQPPSEPATTAQGQRERAWYGAIVAAIHDWQPHVALVIIPPPSTPNPEPIPWNRLGVLGSLRDLDDWADIYIQADRPPIQRLPNGIILPARAADTRYDVIRLPLDPGNPSGTIAPTVCEKRRFLIRIGLTQGNEGLQATARHELGHALGLWGHSDRPDDVMYPAQNNQYPAISPRDLRTLQWVYAQPPRSQDCVD